MLSHIHASQFLLAVFDHTNHATVALSNRGETNLIQAALHFLRTLVTVEKILTAASHACHAILTSRSASCLGSSFVNWLARDRSWPCARSLCRRGLKRASGTDRRSEDVVVVVCSSEGGPDVDVAQTRFLEVGIFIEDMEEN